MSFYFVFLQSYHNPCVEDLALNQSSVFYPNSNLTLWGPRRPFSAEEAEDDSSCGKACLEAIGIGMVLVGEVRFY